ncbi:serine/threonine-protein kinase [Actinomadura viridis]|uniref:serine/threonine-protein kinase n=1 Tax=Actinomadura viridis TaxID=58110 RepID=UPI0036A3E9EA
MAEETRPGRVIGGRYRLVDELAAGGFGRVWRAWDTMLEVEVAVKEVWLHPGISGPVRDDMLRRATREARNAARLRNHPNIVTVHDVAIEDGVPWTVMQLVTGRSLHERVREQGPLKPKAAEKVARAVLKALEKAHEAGIVHRDVKPANVMLATDGEVLLTDFGIALQRNETRLTEPGTFIGTAEYLAPERIRGRDERAASDLFSLGSTLYYAVEGVSPFHRDAPDEIYGAILTEEAPVPRRAGRLALLIERLLRKDPDRRPTATRALELLDLPPTKVATTPPQPKPKPKPRPKPQPEPKPKPPPKTAPPPPAKKTEPAKPKVDEKKAESSDDTWMWVVGIAAVICGLLYVGNPGFADAVSDMGLAADLASVEKGDCLHRGKKLKWVEVPCWSAAADRTVTTTASRSTYLIRSRLSTSGSSSTSTSPCRLYGGSAYEVQDIASGRILCTTPKQ